MKKMMRKELFWRREICIWDRVRDTSAQLKAGGEFRRDTDEGGQFDWQSFWWKW